jgi:cold shock protein
VAARAGGGGECVKGSVKSYDPRRGMGAIAPDGGGIEVPFFASEVERGGFARVAEGDRVSFDVRTDRALRRRFAVNLAAI